jgi:hypothetical protein
MLTENTLPQEATPQVRPGNYNPVTVNLKDTVGAIFLGILSVILLIGWQRSEIRYRKLLKQLDTRYRNQLSDTR